MIDYFNRSIAINFEYYAHFTDQLDDEIHETRHGFEKKIKIYFINIMHQSIKITQPPFSTPNDPNDRFHTITKTSTQPQPETTRKEYFKIGITHKSKADKPEEDTFTAKSFLPYVIRATNKIDKKMNKHKLEATFTPPKKINNISSRAKQYFLYKFIPIF